MYPTSTQFVSMNRLQIWILIAIQASMVHRKWMDVHRATHSFLRASDALRAPLACTQCWLQSMMCLIVAASGFRLWIHRRSSCIELQLQIHLYLTYYLPAIFMFRKIPAILSIPLSWKRCYMTTVRRHTHESLETCVGSTQPSIDIKLFKPRW